MSNPPERVRENTFPLPQGLYINYRLTGTGDSVIVALHGFGGSLDTWDGIEPILSADHRFYAIDLPGFGLSAHPRHFGYTLKEQSESVAAFLQFVHDENPGRQITLMGHSFGGSIAIASAVLLLDRRKTLVDSLILIDALGFPQITHLPLALNILRVPVLSHLVLHLVPARSLARSALRSGMYRRDRVTNEQVCRFAQFINVEGGHDSLLSPDQAELLHRALPGARPVVFVEAGHLAHQELPEDTAKLIEEFLAQGPKRAFHKAPKAVRFGS
jgi:pimeloyl-ACP methyl ester carboxylesterase